MNILYVTTTSETINAFLIPHIEMLVGKGYKVDIATNISNKLDSSLLSLGCKIYDVPFQRNPLSYKNIESYIYLKKILKNNYNIVHTHTPVASFICRMASAKHRKNGLKVIYTAHGFHFYEGSPLLNWLVFYPIEWFMSRYTDDIITINKEDYLLAKDRFKKSKIYYIPGVGINLKKFQKIDKDLAIDKRFSLGLNKDDVVLMYVAELNKNKNQSILINAVGKLAKSDSRYKLLLVGTGPFSERYKGIIKNTDLADNVIFLGRRNDIVELLSITDIYLASSKREGLPVNILEAMAVGLPILASDNRGHRELILPEVNGFIFEEDNHVLLANMILKLNNNEEMKESFSETSKVLVEQFDLNNILKLLDNIYVDS